MSFMSYYYFFQTSKPKSVFLIFFKKVKFVVSYCPTPFQGEGTHSLEGEGAGGSQFGRGERHCGTLGLHVLCGVYHHLSQNLLLDVKVKSVRMYFSVMYQRALSIQAAVKSLN